MIKSRLEIYIRRNYLSWIDVILSCLFNLAQMFVCQKNLACSNEELKGWLIQLLGLYQKLTTDRENENWNCPRAQNSVLQKEKRKMCFTIFVMAWVWFDLDLRREPNVMMMTEILADHDHSLLSCNNFNSGALVQSFYHSTPLQLLRSFDSLSIICLRSKSDAMGPNLRSISNKKL